MYGIEILSSGGRGDYQVRDLTAHLAKAIENYKSNNGDMSLFRLPLFADVGTGKTPSTLVYIEAVRAFLREQGDDRAEKPVLFVVPASVKWNWVHEARRWTDHDDINIFIVDGPAKARAGQIQYVKLIRPKVVIINYELLTIHQQDFQGMGDDDDPFFLAAVADEVHRIKWKDRQRSRAVRSVCAHFHVGLTGTPITNRPDSIHGILEWLDNTKTFVRSVPGKPPKPNKNCPRPAWIRRSIAARLDGCRTCPDWDDTAETCYHYKKTVARKPFTKPHKPTKIRYRSTSKTWGTFDNFKLRYCEVEEVWTGRFWTTRVTGPKMSAMPELHQRLVDFGMIRWRRSEVLKLQPIVYEYVALKPADKQREIYDALKAGFLRTYQDDGSPLPPMQIRSILAQLTYFRRVTTLTPREFHLSLNGQNPAFAPDLKISLSDKGAKQEWLLDFIKTVTEENGNGDKFMIFAEWTAVLRPLVKRIANLGLDVDIIDGSTPKPKRQEIAERWNSDPSFKVLVLSPAAFEGINLQGGLTNHDTMYVVILNFTWGPQDTVQAIGRAWRFGQEAQVVVLFPYLTGTIDEKMAAILQEKQEAADVAVDNGNAKTNNLFKVNTTRQAIDMI